MKCICRCILELIFRPHDVVSERFRLEATNLSSCPTMISSHSSRHSPCRLFVHLIMSASLGKTLSFFTQVNPPTCCFWVCLFVFFWVFLNSQICCRFCQSCERPFIANKLLHSIASYSECHQKSFNKWLQQQRTQVFLCHDLIIKW